MNKQFVKKMIAAKKMEYEAMKELLPDGVKDLLKNTEHGLVEFTKEVAVELYFSGHGNSKEDGKNDQSEENTGRKTAGKVNKVQID